jgi:phosphopentomutase
MSKGGKDSVTGHWEMMGITIDKPFPTYPQGFPKPLMQAFEARIGSTTLGNRPASGTVIVEELGAEHLRTSMPIVYTSADSVFQIACHEEVVPIDKLYDMCRIARELCVGEDAVQRVIARPFLGKPGAFVRTDRRKDFPLPPPENVVDRIAARFGPVFGIGVVPELFNGRGFLSVKRTQNNAEHAVLLSEAIEGDHTFIFANFEDTDMRFGHRNDPTGFARCLKEFDIVLTDVLSKLRDDDLLILTADHGNDPTTPSTDHSREYVPFVKIRKGSGVRERLGDLRGFAHVGAAVEKQLGLV